MGGSRGLMGAEAFAQLRAMVDALLAKKADCADDGVSAKSAVKLKTARRLTFEGAASGSALFDGSGDVTVTLSSSAQAPSFLAAHPPGSIYRETTGRSPAAEWGGTWRLVDSLDGFAWLRTDSGQSDNFTAAQFLAAHPVGCIFEWNKAINPGAVFGGTWRQTPSIGAYTFERTE